ncbi:dTDP-4-dehydrorhamnose reductase [Vibrio breoganii]|uniref:dTDP-4-dehydrorhamnose reductase n=1 Tax=Vibrio breoganii TaxID=553239 RepID=UPI000C861933|nr:dTDP-4-dehydrorhamnose reductase [Vibrio breoganii]PMG35989.1 dTDP-4-dehydrorhamnose reductase [Vibrio breoganii]PMK33161.1 dTDP-4-dehydrorhamnose reductase [Vibrio breoganii]PML54652.1 dTDP-4-dehydrorhamnose reductase [Vibrio breoganii]PMO80934.1 dTDP-4-dehydrorhamnose reductase [Vibrio breoganii]PMP05090.1 dTDP-4-dehydrorhamnose reductase [Vibrio breoganii]
MRVLVTGSKGQVGRCLVEQLQNNVELLAVDRYELDITNRDAVFRKIAEFKPDFVINAAAHTAVDKAEEQVDASYAVNRDGAKYLAEASKSVGGSILHISTDYVFSGNKLGDYVETDETGPLGIYGKSKLAGELAVASANCNHIILRTAWVFCEYGNNFVKTMLRLAKDRDQLDIVGDQIGGPTYARDIAKALILIMNELHGKKSDTRYGIYHFSGTPHVSWCEFAEMVFVQGLAKGLIEAPEVIPIPTHMYPTLAPRPTNSKMNCQKIKNAFDIEASDWQSAIKNIEEYVS